MQYELRGHTLYQRILADAEYQQRVLVFSVARNFGGTRIARYFYFHETLSQEAYREFDLSQVKHDGREPSLNLVVAMGSGGSPEILKTARAHVLSDFFARHRKTTLSFSTSKGDALAFVRLVVNVDGVPYRVTLKMNKWMRDLAVSWQKVTGIVVAARELPTSDPWNLPPEANIYSESLSPAAP